MKTRSHAKDSPVSSVQLRQRRQFSHHLSSFIRYQGLEKFGNDVSPTFAKIKATSFKNAWGKFKGYAEKRPKVKCPAVRGLGQSTSDSFPKMPIVPWQKRSIRSNRQEKPTGGLRQSLESNDIRYDTTGARPILDR